MARKNKLIHRKEVTLNVPAVKTPGWLQGFTDFIREQGVVGLAVGLILGVAAKSLIDSLVANLFNPFIGLFYGGGEFTSKFWCLNTNAAESCTNKLAYGQFINDLISFIIVATVVYFVVKKLHLDKLDKEKKENKDNN
jgi:large conductance mechanosensitive channel